MPRNKRIDPPGAWHHVMNRGLARRPVFETQEDIRFFLSRLAWASRRHGIEIHAWAVLTTHFHLLVRCPKGGLSRALAWIANQYVRWFNRRRRRDGSLFRGRFTSKLVVGATHWDAVVRYIDRNPVEAGLALNPVEYPFCSAYHYNRPKGPVWATRTSIEATVSVAAGREVYRPSDYGDVFDCPSPRAFQWLVETRAAFTDAAVDPLDDLLEAAPARVREHLLRSATRADGHRKVPPVAPPWAIDEAVREHAVEDPDWTVTVLGHRRKAWPALRAGLLQTVACLPTAEVALRLRKSQSQAARMTRNHAQLMAHDHSYARRAAQCVQEALHTSFAKRG